MKCARHRPHCVAHAARHRSHCVAHEMRKPCPHFEQAKIFTNLKEAKLSEGAMNIYSANQSEAFKIKTELAALMSHSVEQVCWHGMPQCSVCVGMA
jgi:hypothetical protein